VVGVADRFLVVGVDDGSSGVAGVPTGSSGVVGVADGGCC
jgi:hypothetical protein